MPCYEKKMPNLKGAELFARQLINRDYTFLVNGKEKTYNPGKNGFKFLWGAGTQHTLGNCKIEQNTQSKEIIKAQIRISKKITECNLAQFDKIHLVILHEIAHALAFLAYGSGQHHNSNWQYICTSIGGDGKRLCDDANLRYPEVHHKYQYQCPGCKTIYPQKRKATHPRSCGKCAPKYDERFRIVLI